MFQPAARAGDTTAHGGAIAAGFPTVHICGTPAARSGDVHVCPMLTPGAPPVPHIGGLVSSGSSGVYIGGMPAARMGDTATCCGPPDSIVSGCPTVLIGETSSADNNNSTTAITPLVSAIETSALFAGEPAGDQDSDHFIDLNFHDKAKLTISGVHYSLAFPDTTETHGSLGRQIKKGGVPEGDYSVTLRAIVDAQWSVKYANVGDIVTLSIETIGIPDGRKALVTVYMRDTDYTDYKLATLETSINNDSAAVSWKFDIDDDYFEQSEKKRSNGDYSQPFFFFTVSISDLHERSGFLSLKDWMEIITVQEDDTPASNRRVILHLTNGEVREEISDENGIVRIENISPSVTFAELPEDENNE